MKRIIVATLMGLVAGGICATGAFYGDILKFTPLTLGWILLNRAVMGAAIGASGLRVHWAWNGIVMGILVGSIFAYYLFMNVTGLMPAMNALVNGVFGLLIEFFTTVVFKQPAAQASRTLEPAQA